MSNLAEVQDSSGMRSYVVTRKGRDIHFLPVNKGECSLIQSLMTPQSAPGIVAKATDTGEAVSSAQGVNVGLRYQPFDMRAVAAMQSSNGHHVRCLETKINATVGLGFKGRGTSKKQKVKKQKVNPPKAGDSYDAPSPMGEIRSFEPTHADEVLNPLCDHTFHDLTIMACEDYWQVGNGYLEVVRASAEENAPITGLHLIPAADVFVYIEDQDGNFHYEIMGPESPTSRHFARWADTPNMLRRGGGQFAPTGKTVSEVIPFPYASSANRWYGIPRWLAGVSSIELVAMAQQYKYDFFLNRGVPEFMLFITGATLTTKEWAIVTDAVKANIGTGNSHKTIALNLPHKEVVIQLERLAMDSQGEGQDFATLKENLALDIVSVHGVPPLLAGVQIPGKMGAANELPSSLMAFQVTCIGPAQAAFQQRLAMTLGNKKQNGGLDLEPSDFTFRTIVEEINLGTMDTVTRMRQPVSEAQAQGRDPSKGLKT